MKAACPLLSPSTGTRLPSSGKLLGEADPEHGALFGRSHTGAHLVTPFLAGNARDRDVGPALVKLSIAGVASPWGKKQIWGQASQTISAAGTHRHKLHVITQEHVAISNISEVHIRTRQLQAGNCLASCWHSNGF